MPTGPARTADDITDNIRSLVDRMIDAKFTQEMAKRGQEVAAALAERSTEMGALANEAWRDTRPVRRDAAKRLARASDDAAKWSRRSLTPTLRDLWKRRTLAIGAAGAAVPAGRELVDSAAVRLGLKEREERHWGAFFLGLIIGAAAGAIAALLTAPRRGDEMRRELGERAEELATKAKEEWVPIFQREETNGLPEPGAVADTAEATADDAASTLEDAAGETTVAADKAADEVAEAINESYDTVDRESHS